MQLGKWDDKIVKLRLPRTNRIHLVGGENLSSYAAREKVFVLKGNLLLDVILL